MRGFPKLLILSVAESGFKLMSCLTSSKLMYSTQKDWAKKARTIAFQVEEGL